MQPGEPGLFLSGEALLLCSGERRRWRCRILPPEEAQALLSGRGGETGEEQGDGVGAAAKEEVEAGGGGGGGGGSCWARGDPPAPVGLPRAVDAAAAAEEGEAEEALPATPAGVCVATAGPLPFPRVGLAVREEEGGGGGG